MRKRFFGDAYLSTNKKRKKQRTVLERELFAESGKAWVEEISSQNPGKTPVRSNIIYGLIPASGGASIGLLADTGAQIHGEESKMIENEEEEGGGESENESVGGG
eukprot:15324650-Ditylum_brightwellii.AAC.1